jgi:predicted AlkP superfamily pyrophosphatase or phosphodiesterase
LADIDKFTEKLQLQIEARNLTNILDIIFVSDHGMTDTPATQLIYLDEYIGSEGVGHLEHIDGWPGLGLRFKEDLGETQALQLVEKLATAAQIAGTFEVYAKSDHFARGVAEVMPERWHYDHNERIAPVWVVPKIGYVITTKARGDAGMSLGVSSTISLCGQVLSMSLDVSRTTGMTTLSQECKPCSWPTVPSLTKPR